MPMPSSTTLATGLIDIEQILIEAQSRWLRPAEICEILQNYKNYCISPEPANMPQNGSIFLFDRKVLRYFRNDGHNWRKSKDGKTVKEAHERLKAGSIDVLHCYYAHGEDNENFQRRSYWLLEAELSHIALVHYREVKGNRTNFNRIKGTEEAVPYYQETEPNPISDDYQRNFSTISGVDFASLTQADKAEDSKNAGLKILDFPSWEDNLGNGTSGNQAVTFQPSFPETQPDTNGVLPEQENPTLEDLFNSYFDETLEFGNQPQIQKECQGNRTNFNCINETEEAVPYYRETEPNPISDDYQGNFSTISGVDFASLTQADDSNNAGLKILDFPSWEDDLGNGNSGNQAVTFQPSFPETQPDTNGVLPEQENPILGDLFNCNFDETLEFRNQPQIQTECQGNRTNFNRIKGTEEVVPYYQETEPNPISDDYQGNFSTISGVDFASPTQADKADDSNNAGLKILDFPSWEDDLGNGTSGNQAVTFQPSFPETQPDTNRVFPEQENPIPGDPFNSNFDETLEFGNRPQIQKECQVVSNAAISNYISQQSYNTRRTNFNRIKGTEETVPYFQETEPNPISDDYQGNFSTISGVDFASLTQANKADDSNNAGLKILDFPSWEDDLGNGTSANQAVTFQPSFPETQPDTNGVLPEQENPIPGDLFNSNFDETLEFGNQPQIQKECQGNRTNFNCIKATEETVPYFQETEPNPISDDYQGNFSTISGVDFASFTQANKADDSNNAGLKILDFPSWEDDLGNGTSGNQAVTFQPSFPETQPDTNGVLPEQENPILGDLFNSNFDETLEFGNQPQIQKECQGNRTNFNHFEETEEAVPYFQETEPNPISDDYQGNLPTISGVDFASLTQADKAEDSNSAGLKILDFPSLEDYLGNGTSGNQAVTFQPSFFETQPDTNGVFPEQENPILGDLFNSNFDETREFGNQPQIRKNSEGEWPLNQNVHAESVYGVTCMFQEQDVNRFKLHNSWEPILPKTDKQDNDPMQNNLQVQLSNADHGYYRKSNPEINTALEGKTNSSFTIKQTRLDGSLTEELKKLHSFNRWMSKELGDVNESHTQSSSGAYWDTVESENRVDESNISHQVRLINYTLGPTLSQDQLFSIIDFSPNWAYEGSKVKVLITGRFLKSQQEVENCKWSCMFGEAEVPAEVIADGVIRCHTPVHKAARVPFYVTCSNRLACSEVQEFEYRVSLIKDVDIIDNYSGNRNHILLIRFKKLLSLTSACTPNTDSICGSEKSQVSSKISSLLEADNDEWDQMLKLKDFCHKKVQDKLLEKQLKDMLHVWLLQKAAEDGKGPSVLDEGGQGVLHFAAALGYDWALEPTIIAGVSVNLHDVNGWTALHWAAFCGRERTVAFLVSLGAAPGALTDPSPKYPSGRTAADLASANRHKGIAGYLAESHLSTHLPSLKLDTREGDAAEISGAKAVQKVSERSATPVGDGDLPYELSLKDSLTAVINASPFHHIHQVLRVESFNFIMKGPCKRPLVYEEL